MNWSKQPPTEPGFYWWRSDISMHGEVVMVTPSRRVLRPGMSSHGDPDQREYTENAGGEWYGPLLEPGGDAVENCPLPLREVEPGVVACTLQEWLTHGPECVQRGVREVRLTDRKSYYHAGLRGWILTLDTNNPATADRIPAQWFPSLVGYVPDPPGGRLVDYASEQDALKALSAAAIAWAKPKRQA